MKNKFHTKCIKLGVIIVGILIGNAVLAGQAHAVTILAQTTVEFAPNATLGSCMVTVANGPKPITYSHDCRLTIAGIGIDSSDLNISNVSYAGNTAGFTSSLFHQGSPTINCKYCAEVKNIKVRNSAGVLILESVNGNKVCKKNKGTIT